MFADPMRFTVLAKNGLHELNDLTSLAKVIAMFLNVCFLARILDVRGEEDFLRGHLRGAYNVPWAEIASRGFEYLGANVVVFWPTMVS